MLCEGCRWCTLPGDFAAWQTVYIYFRNWRLDRTWVRLDQEREASCSNAIVDSQRVKTAAISAAVGDDAAKHINGRNRHLTVDTLELVLRGFASIKLVVLFKKIRSS